MKLRFIAGEEVRDILVAEQISAGGGPVFGGGFWVGRKRQFFFEQRLRGIDSAFPIQALEEFVPPAAIERGQIIEPRSRPHFRRDFHIERARRELAHKFRGALRGTLQFLGS